MGKESPLCCSIATWICHIDRFERQYDKAFLKEHLFGADISNIIHKRLQVFLQSCNTTEIEDVELGTFAEFGSLQNSIERGEWLTTTPVWVEMPSPKEEGKRKLEGNRNRTHQGIGGRYPVQNSGVNPQLRAME